MARKKFVRRDTAKRLRLGMKSKKKQVWRKAKGRDNKIRGKRKGYPKKPTIGYGAAKANKGLVNGLKLKAVYNLNDFNSINKNEIAVIGGIGNKKKIEIAKKAIEKKIKILNLNAKKFIKKIEDERKRKEERKKKEETKKKKTEGKMKKTEKASKKQETAKTSEQQAKAAKIKTVEKENIK